MKTILAALVLLAALAVGSPADAVVHGCTYGSVSVFPSSTGPDQLLSLTNTSGKTASIRATVYNWRTGGKVIHYFLNVPDGTRKYTSDLYTYLKVEYKRSDWTSYRFGCERSG